MLGLLNRAWAAPWIGRQERREPVDYRGVLMGSSGSRYQNDAEGTRSGADFGAADALPRLSRLCFANSGIQERTRCGIFNRGEIVGLLAGPASDSLPDRLCRKDHMDGCEGTHSALKGCLALEAPNVNWQPRPTLAAGWFEKSHALRGSLRIERRPRVRHFFARGS